MDEVKPLSAYVFLHKRLVGVRFAVSAYRFYEAIEALEGLLGPEKHWMHEYIVLSQGREVCYKSAA